MVSVSVKEARDNLRALLERAQAGEEVIILKRGKEVARLVPPSQKRRLPSMTQFRASIKLEGEPLGRTLVRARDEEWP